MTVMTMMTMMVLVVIVMPSQTQRMVLFVSKLSHVGSQEGTTEGFEGRVQLLYS